MPGDAPWILKEVPHGKVVMPWAHAAPYGAPGGKSNEIFERYLVEEVVPMVDAGYRTDKEQRQAGLGRAVDGGCVAWRRPTKNFRVKWPRSRSRSATRPLPRQKIAFDG